MKKVLFLMVLLLLMGLGTASVSAQVRIGGNTPPNASAVLDLNADGTNSGTKGLALPRVALTSNQMLLPGVSQNLTGMLVYNTSTTGTGVNSIGIYFWNGAMWVKASLPSTTAADSGKVLMSNGSGFVFSGLASAAVITTDTFRLRPQLSTTSWSLVFDTTFDYNVPAWSTYRVVVPNLRWTDFCYRGMSQSWANTSIKWWNDYLYLDNHSAVVTAGTWSIRCYRPTF